MRRYSGRRRFSIADVAVCGLTLVTFACQSTSGARSATPETAQVELITPSPVAEQVEQITPTPDAEQDKQISPTPDPPAAEETAAPRIPFGMRFAPVDRICDYSVVVLWRMNLLDSRKNLVAAPLEEARSCGTEVVVRLFGLTRHIVNDNGVGLNLEKYEDRINDFSGLIDSYVEDGTIIAHITIDEPHDCINDWGGDCPEPEEVDQAAQISKQYWPGLSTIINTGPGYASGYQWIQTDSVNFQYAYHKGDLNKFIRGALEVLESGKVGSISWSIQASSGGCMRFGECSMSPAQVAEVGQAMCETGEGLFITFSNYEEALLTEGMQESIHQVRNVCGDP